MMHNENVVIGLFCPDCKRHIQSDDMVWPDYRPERRGTIDQSQPEEWGMPACPYCGEYLCEGLVCTECHMNADDCECMIDDNYSLEDCIADEAKYDAETLNAFLKGFALVSITASISLYLVALVASIALRCAFLTDILLGAGVLLMVVGIVARFIALGEK